MTSSPPPAPPYDEPTRTAPTCYRHPQRETYISCTRCDRPICPECMTPASVGFHCPECVREGQRSVRTPSAPFGGRATTRTPVTYALIAVNVAVFLATFVGASSLLGGGTSSLFDRLALVTRPAGQLPDGTLVVLPGGVADGQYYRLLTSMFLHAGLIHLALNMYALFLLGPQLERVFGWARFLAVYLLAGLGGSVATYLFVGPGTPTVGASGAIFGLFAAYFLVARRVGADTRGILLTVGINLFLTFAIAQISKTGHLGGLAVGALAAAVVVHAPHGPRRGALQVAGLATIAALLVLATALHTIALR